MHLPLDSYRGCQADSEGIHQQMESYPIFGDFHVLLTWRSTEKNGKYHLSYAP